MEKYNLLILFEDNNIGCIFLGKVEIKYFFVYVMVD